MTMTTRLGLPLIAPEQAQKHLTHNEALLALDGIVHLRLAARGATVPPGEPDLGASYALGVDAEGGWAGHDGENATWTEGGWRFAVPGEGWLGWDEGAGAPLVFRQGSWQPLFADVPGIGVGAAPDLVNRLAVRSEAALFTAVPEGEGGNGNVRLTLNKETGADSGTLLFQSGWAGRAEIGLAGNDHFSFKVSADGVAFITAMTLDADTGFVSFGRMFGAVPETVSVAGGVLAVKTGCVVPVPESGNADDIVTIAGGFDGALLVVAGSAGRTLTLKHGTGNLALGTDRVLAGAGDALLLVRMGGVWVALS